MSQTNNPDKSSVASHSCTDGNSIGHFKVLMYSWISVDPNRLEEGIYQSARPVLYNKDETIDSLIKNVRWLNDLGYLDTNLPLYEENIKKCRLVPAQVVISEHNDAVSDTTEAK